LQDLLVSFFKLPNISSDLTKTIKSSINKTRFVALDLPFMQLSGMKPLMIFLRFWNWKYHMR